MSSSFAQGIYFAQRRTHDGRVRGIASAIPGRHPRGAHVEIVRLVFFLLGEMTPASFAWHVGVRLGRLAHGVRRERSRAARRLHSGPEQRARPPPFLWLEHSAPEATYSVYNIYNAAREARETVYKIYNPAREARSTVYNI